MNQNVAPSPTLPSAQTRPPCLVTIRWTIARPIPVPGNSSARVQALEHAEQLADVLHVEADAVVLDEEHGLVALGPSAYLDHRVRLRTAGT